jgi:hypothetical protein
MLIFLGVQTAVDVNHLLPSMLIFSLLVTGPQKSKENILRPKSKVQKNQKKTQKKPILFPKNSMVSDIRYKKFI